MFKSVEEQNLEKPPAQEQEKTPQIILKKEAIEIKTREEKLEKSAIEKRLLPEDKSPSSEKTETIQPKIKRRPKLKPKPPKTIKKWEEKWVVMEGKKTLFVPSGFEIMTKDGWRPLMMRPIR